MAINNNYPVKENSVSSFLAEVETAAKNSETLKNKKATAPVKPNDLTVGSSIIGKTSRVTKDIALSTGFGGYFKSGSTLNQELHLFEFMLPVTVKNSDKKDLVKSATYASGFRVVFHITDIKADLEVGFAGFAAQSELGLANIKVLFEIFGLGKAKLAVDLADLFLFKKFDVESYNKIIETQRSLVKFFRDSSNEFVPELVSVEIDPNIEFTNKDRQSKAFAYAQVIADNTLDGALQIAQDRDDISIDENTVIKAYYEIIEEEPLKDNEIDTKKAEIINKNIRPSHRRRARRLLERL